MTGGQPTTAARPVPMIVAQMQAEGVKPIVIVTDEPEKYDAGHRFARASPSATATISTRCSASCATSARRDGAHLRPDLRLREAPAPQARRYPDPAKRVVINEAVCEGCGDCSVQVELHVGRAAGDRVRPQAQINQSSCNKDYSCLKGFCPSFVTVEGGSCARARRAAQAADEQLPGTASRSRLARGTWGILVTGIGGTGVITIGQLIGMAAHLEGKGVSVLDMAGLAQKGGAVFSHVRIATAPEDLHARASPRRGRPRDRLRPRGDRERRGAGKMAAGARARSSTPPPRRPPTFVRDPDWRLPAAGPAARHPRCLAAARAWRLHRRTRRSPPR
jgi:indolepyruvate ferredoxin oxidoreductase